MATLYITEFRYIGQHGVQAPECPPIADQTPLTISGTTNPSAAFNAGTKFIRLHTDTACSIQFGAAPVATTSMLRMPAGATEYFSVLAGQKVAVIAN